MQQSGAKKRASSPGKAESEKSANGTSGKDETAESSNATSGSKGKDAKKKEADNTWIMKAVALAVLSVQHCAVGLITRKSRTTGTGQFLPQTGVISQEILKFLFCLGCVIYTGESVVSVFSRPHELVRSSVPAVLYLVQNNLQYVALGHLDPATYVVTYQLKILSTAVMSVVLLKREISLTKWIALALLVIGVSTVQLSSLSTSSDSDSDTGVYSQQFLGLVAVLTTCVLSGLAGVYTEKILKMSSVSLWARNVQLALFSIVAGVIGLAITDDLAKTREHGFFQGYNSWVFASVVNNSFGGLLIAVIIKYADNIIKNFATAISIVLTTAISIHWLGLAFTFTFGLGVAIVCFSSFLYGGALDSYICSLVAKKGV